MRDHMTPAERLERYQRRCRLTEYAFVAGFALFLFLISFWSI